MHSLAAFCQNPAGISFQTQDIDEVIVLFLRRHIITNVPWILGAVFLIIAPLLILGTLRLFNNAGDPLASLPSGYAQILTLFYYLFVFAYIFINFISWFYNISLVTTTRIVDIDFSDLIYQNVAVTRLNLVEDVDYTQVGFIRSFFNFGDVFVQTAGEKPNFDFLAVPKPAIVTKLILDLIGGGPHGP